MPKWHDVKFGVHEEDANCGAVLVSFSVFRGDDEIPFYADKDMPVGKDIKKKEYEVLINVLGLRNLKSSGILPIQRASIKMKVTSMLPPGVTGIEDRNL